MKINWKKIFVGFFVFSAVMFMCNLIFRYFQYVDIYSKEYQRASIYVQTDVCTNMLNRAKVGDFGRCDDAEQELETSPEWKATRQIMDDLWLFGEADGRDSCGLLSLTNTTLLLEYFC